MFNDRFGLTQAVIDGQKTKTRRLATEDDVKEPKSCWGLEGKDKGHLFLCDGSRIVAKSLYKVGEEVAVAQGYVDVLMAMIDSKGGYGEEEKDLDEKLGHTKGYYNKMFVKADLMPHRIKIAGIRAERLQTISDVDCIKEGILWVRHLGFCVNTRDAVRRWLKGDSYKEAYAYLIDKVSGKGTWERNPWVFVYEFEKIK